MTLPATIEQPAAQTEQIAVKTRRISPRIVHAIELLVSGECTTIKAAAEKANLSREGLSKALSKVHVAAYLERQTRITLARLQAPAAGRLAHLLGQAASEHVQKDVAIHVLNIAGHKPAERSQVSVNIDIKAGYVIDISDQREKPSVTTIDARLTQHEE